MLNNPENFNNNDDDNDKLNTVSHVAAPPPAPAMPNLGTVGKAKNDRSALVEQINGGNFNLKKAPTNDKSSTKIAKAAEQKNVDYPRFEDKNSQLSVKEKMNRMSGNQNTVKPIEESDEIKLNRKIKSIVDHQDELKSKTEINSIEVQEQILAARIKKVEAKYSQLTVAIAERKNHSASLNHLLTRMLESGLASGGLFSEITARRAELDKEMGKIAEAQKDWSNEWESLRKTTALIFLNANQTRIAKISEIIAKATSEAEVLIESVYGYRDVTALSSSNEVNKVVVDKAKAKFQELLEQQRAKKLQHIAGDKGANSNAVPVQSKEQPIIQLLDKTSGLPKELEAFETRVEQSIEAAIRNTKVVPTNIDDLHSEIAKLRARIAELEGAGNRQEAATFENLIFTLEKSVAIARSDNKAIHNTAEVESLRAQVAKQAEERELLVLAAHKLEDDAQKLKQENTHLLEELARSRQEAEAAANRMAQAVKSDEEKELYKKFYTSSVNREQQKQAENQSLERQLRELSAKYNELNAAYNSSPFVVLSNYVSTSLHSSYEFLASSAAAKVIGATGGLVTIANMVLAMTKPEYALLNEYRIYGKTLAQLAIATYTFVPNLFTCYYLAASSRSGEQVAGMVLSGLSSVFLNTIASAALDLSLPNAILIGATTGFASYAIGSQESYCSECKMSVSDTLLTAAFGLTAIDCASRMTSNTFSPLSQYGMLAAGIIPLAGAAQVYLGKELHTSRTFGEQALVLTTSALATAVTTATLAYFENVQPLITLGVSSVVLGLSSVREAYSR